MTQTKTPKFANFKTWLDDTNKMGQDIGDLDNLLPEIDPQFGGAPDDNLVSALNSVASGSSTSQRFLLIRAIAMS